MKHLLNMAKNGDQEEEASPMSDMQVKAKSDVLHQLLKESDMMAGNGISEGLGKKVTVAADSQEGLEEGLDVAEDVVEGDPMMDAPDEEIGEGEDVDIELEAILRELEEEPVDEAHHEEEPVAEGEDKEEMTEEEDAEVSIEEVIKALREEEEEVKEEEEEKIEETEDKEADEKDLEEAYKVIKFLRSKINEVNLLNAKLLFSNKLFRNYPLSESQKMKVIENFDRAQSLREVKLVFGTLAESFASSKTKRTVVKESYASKASRSTAPKKEILSEGNALAARWKKLANLK